MTHNNINEDVKKLLIFMHIPKTGGTTLTPIISKQYPINILVFMLHARGPLLISQCYVIL